MLLSLLYPSAQPTSCTRIFALVGVLLACNPAGQQKPDVKLSMTACLLSANSYHSKHRQNQHKLNDNHLQYEKSWVIVFCVRTTKLYLHGLRRDPNSTVFMLFCSLGDSL